MHSHSNPPKPVARSKFRETSSTVALDHDEPPANIMFDRRVRRGATQGRPILTTSAENTGHSTTTPGHSAPSTPALGAMHTHTKTLKERLLPEPDSLGHILKHAVAVKKRVEVPIHLYLEEQTTAVPVTETDTQTDEFLENVPRQVYIRPKVGVDVRIQVLLFLVVVLSKVSFHAATTILSLTRTGRNRCLLFCMFACLIFSGGNRHGI
jgi:hypothetical protein